VAPLACFVNGDSTSLTMQAPAAQAWCVKALIGRLVRTKNDIHHVRRNILMPLRPRGLADPFSRFCRTYGFVDRANGKIRGSEAGRFLLFVYLFKTSSNRVAATVDAAVRANKLMIVGSTFRRLEMEFKTADRGVQFKGPKRSNEDRGVLRIVLDDWLYGTLQGYERQYRNATGIVDDMRLITDILRASLGDPEIPTIVAYYRQRVEPLRETMRQIEEYARPLLRRGIGQEADIGRLARVG
jgi:hypothetical protein